MISAPLRVLALALLCSILPRQGMPQGRRFAETEPNNALTEANLVVLGDTVFGAISFNVDDFDDFAIDLTAGTALDIRFDGEAFRERVVVVYLIQVLPSPGDWVNSRAVAFTNPYARDGRNRHLWYVVPESGRYYVGVGFYVGQPSGQSRSYQLTFGTGTPPPGPGDPTRVLASDIAVRQGGFAADAAGNLFVTDAQRRGQRVLKIGVDGSIVPSKVYLLGPEGLRGALAVDGFGDLLVAGTGYWDNQHRTVIWRYASTGERSVFTWDTRPAAIALAPDGDIWVADEDGGGLTQYDPLGNLRKTWRPNADAMECEHGFRPWAIAFSPSGVLHVGACRGVYTLTDNTFSLVILAGGDMAFDRDGFLYMTDGYGKTISLYSPDYRLIEGPFVRNGLGPNVMELVLDRTPGSSRLFAATASDPDSGAIVEVNPSAVRAPGGDPASRFSLHVPEIKRLVRIGMAYADTLRVTNAAGAVSWTRLGGELTPGLTLDETRGIISGTIGDSGSYVFAVRATSGSQVGFGRVSIVSTAAPPLAIVSDSVRPSATVGAAYRDTLVAEGATGTYEWAISSGLLPHHLTLDPGTGVISGVGAFATNQSFEVTVVSGVQRTTRLFHLRMGTFSIASSADRPPGVMGRAYADTLRLTPGGTSATWTLSAGALPRGLAFWQGFVSGIPQASGTFSYTASVTVGNERQERSFTLSVSTPVIALDAVVTHLLGAGAPLTTDEVRYLDYLGNNNGQLDIGDVVVWLKKGDSGS